MPREGLVGSAVTINNLLDNLSMTSKTAKLQKKDMPLSELAHFNKGTAKTLQRFDASTTYLSYLETYHKKSWYARKCH